MIIKQSYESNDSKFKGLKIQLSNGDDIRIYDGGQGYCSVTINRHESFKQTSGGYVNKSKVDFIDKENDFSASRVCETKEINVESSDSTTTVAVKHFKWK